MRMIETIFPFVLSFSLFSLFSLSLFVLDVRNCLLPPRPAIIKLFVCIPFVCFCFLFRQQREKVTVNDQKIRGGEREEVSWDVPAETEGVLSGTPDLALKVLAAETEGLDGTVVANARVGDGRRVLIKLDDRLSG